MISTDGQYCGNIDSPGQGSVYIPSASRLASAGFYYSGYKDRVKCFSCGMSVENWIIRDNPEDSQWHRTNCEFVNGRDRSNAPLNRDFRWYFANARQQSPTSFNNGERQRGNFTSLVISGGDYTQQNISPTNFSTNASSYQSSASNINSISTIRGTEFTQYACNHPVNPHMRSRSLRLETFKPRNDSRWPREKVRAGVEEIADAGFFYLGDRDRVKCWYCNGGLENWDYTDDPITEHAKWFPSCEFVLRLKGPDFVSRITLAHPNLNRPTPVRRRPSHGSSFIGDIGPPSPEYNQSTQPPLTSNEAATRAMTTISYVEQVRQMGFNDEKIKQALKRKYQSTGHFQNNAAELLEDLIRDDSQPNGASRQQTTVNLASTSVSTPSNNETTTSMASQLRQLEQSRLCKVCKNNTANIVLIPCGHLSSCENCAGALRRCPVCHKSVQDSIKTFRA